MYIVDANQNWLLLLHTVCSNADRPPFNIHKSIKPAAFLDCNYHDPCIVLFIGGGGLSDWAKVFGERKQRGGCGGGGGGGIAAAAAVLCCVVSCRNPLL